MRYRTYNLYKQARIGSTVQLGIVLYVHKSFCNEIVGLTPIYQIINSTVVPGTKFQISRPAHSFNSEEWTCLEGG